MKLQYAEISIAGPCESNQDCVGFWQSSGGENPLAVALLADGVGSLGAGDVASGLAVTTGLRVFCDAAAPAMLHWRVAELFKAANWVVYDKGFEQDGPGRIATTMAAAAFDGGKLVVGNVGDSRVYRVRGGAIEQLSVDHSLVGMQRRFGKISEVESRSCTYRHVITRGLGVDPEVRVDMREFDLMAGDHVVLCCDGLYDVVTDEDLLAIVSRYEPAAACRKLVTLAEARETGDNVSVQIIAVESL
jgi:protein phosphatase